MAYPVITNEAIRLLSDRDLMQRYLGTFIRYDGKVKYVSNITNTEIRFSSAENGVDEPPIRFDWSKVDVSRPRSGWYKDVKNHVCLSYYFGRQYHRGFTQQNTFLSGGAGHGRLPMNAWDRTLQNIFDEEPKFQKYQWHEINNRNEMKQIQLSRKLLIDWNGAIMYGLRKIGKMHVTYIELKELFEQELREAISGIPEIRPYKDKSGLPGALLRKPRMRNEPEPEDLPLDEIIPVEQVRERIAARLNLNVPQQAPFPPPIGAPPAHARIFAGQAAAAQQRAIEAAQIRADMAVHAQQVDAILGNIRRP